MSILVRRLLFYLLCALFLIVAPVLLGYTSGFRWSSTQHRLVKIGALSIASLPDGATVTINGQPQGRTPVLLRNLHPGLYEIVLTKEDYWPWSKTLAVESERTTFAHATALFKIATPRLTKEKFPVPKPKPPASLDSYKVFTDASRGKIIVIDNERQIKISELEGTQAVWKTEDTPLLFSYSPHEVWQYNPKTNERTLITRLLEEIQEVLPLPEREALLLILKNGVRALELDARDHQNSWDLTEFTAIQSTRLLDKTTLRLWGTREGQTGVWELELY